MLNRSKKQKGKLLEKFVADELSKIFAFAYSRADSGSGLHHKEDVSLPANVPLFIECKNQAELSLKEWWDNTKDGCPASKYPVLVYKLNYQKEPTVVMRFCDMIDFLSGRQTTYDPSMYFLNSFKFCDFINFLQMKYDKKS